MKQILRNFKYVEISKLKSERQIGAVWWFVH